MAFGLDCKVHETWQRCTVTRGAYCVYLMVKGTSVAFAFYVPKDDRGRGRDAHARDDASKAGIACGIACEDPWTLSWSWACLWLLGGTATNTSHMQPHEGPHTLALMCTHSGVDRVGDDRHPCSRAVLCDGLHKRGHNASIHVEEVITGHARLAGHACRPKQTECGISKGEHTPDL